MEFKREDDDVAALMLTDEMCRTLSTRPIGGGFRSPWWNAKTVSPRGRSCLGERKCRSPRRLTESIGLIFLDAVGIRRPWSHFAESYAERKKASSPNFETIAENLEKEIAALKRLGRMEEAALAEDRLALARAAMKEISQP